MPEEKKSKSHHVSITNLLLGAVSIGAGAYHGYCDAKGIPFDSKSLEHALTWGPTIIRGAVGAVKEGLVGFISGGAIGGTLGAENSDKLSKIIAGSGFGAIAGTAICAGVGGTVGAVKGGVQTLIGYGIGYLTGAIAK